MNQRKQQELEREQRYNAPKNAAHNKAKQLMPPNGKCSGLRSLGIESIRHCTIDVSITKTSEKRVHLITRTGTSCGVFS